LSWNTLYRLITTVVSWGKPRRIWERLLHLAITIK
jgi:hypothetical protein